MQKLLVLLLVVYSAHFIGAQVFKSTTFISTNAMQDSFIIWKAKYNKQYASNQEESFRFDNFKTAYHIINSHNGSGKSYSMGLNLFADLTIEEFQQLHLRNSKENSQAKRLFSKPFNDKSTPLNNDIPDSFDWRTTGVLGPVRNTGSDNDNEWAYFMTDLLDTFSLIRDGKILFSSAQQLIDCVAEYRGMIKGYNFD